MKRPFLNLWQRLGVVASALWAIGTYLHEMNRQADTAAHVAFDPCNWAPSSEPNCGHAAYQAMMNDAVGAAAAYALIPIPIAWLVAYAVIWVVRWVWAGRRRPEQA